MNLILKDLGVPEMVQQFFDVRELLFNYGGHFEHFEVGFHRVPTTGNLWLAAKDLAKEVVITSTAMEAIAYATFNHHRYPDLDRIAFIALGNLPHSAQMNWIRANYPKRKFTLVFGDDLLGKLADIRVAAGLRGKNIRLLHLDNQVQVAFDGKVLNLPQDALSFSAFEKASGLRSGIRTAKPAGFNTYLEQLKHDAKR